MLEEDQITIRDCFVCCVLALLIPVCGCGKQESEGELNVLLIVLDTTRADALGISGSDRAHTPHLDQLAHEGVFFSHARSTAAWTIPSHGSLFTGLYPSNSGAHHENPRLDPENLTLAEILAPTHQTAGFSENSLIQKVNGFAQGFEHFEEVWRKRTNWRDPPGTLGRVEAWLEGRDPSRPFFVFVNLMTPHLPYDPPPRFKKLFVSEETPASEIYRLSHLGDLAAQRFIIGQLKLGAPELSLLHDLYLADVAFTDEQVGELIELIRAQGILEETLIVVVGDHGENIGDHHLMEHQFSLNETLLRVPMIFRLPGVFTPGETSAAPVQLIDVLPTILDVVGVQREQGDQLDGTSLLDKRPLESRPVFAEFMRPVMQRGIYERLDPRFDFDRLNRRIKSLQVGNMKLIAAEGGEEELFDLERDPGETRDLAQNHPEELLILRRRLDALITHGWTPGKLGNLADVDEDTLRELRSLGYVQ